MKYFAEYLCLLHLGAWGFLSFWPEFTTFVACDLVSSLNKQKLQMLAYVSSLSCDSFVSELKFQVQRSKLT